MVKNLFHPAKNVFIAMALFFSQIAPAAAISLDSLIAEYPNNFPLQDKGSYAGYGNFRDFSSQATGGAVPLNAADIDITLHPVSISSGIVFPFRDLLLFQSDKWAVESGQSLHVAFSYDGLACVECAFLGARLSLDSLITTEDSSISINSRLSSIPNSDYGVPLTVVDQLIQSPQGPSEDVKLFPTDFWGYPSMTVRTDIYLTGGAAGAASLQSFSQAYIVTPLPASALLFVSAILGMGLLRRPNKPD